MRHITALASNAIDRPVTEPRYLIQIELDQVMNLSTREPLSVDGVLWREGEVNLQSVSDNSASLRIYNQDYQFTAAAVRGGYHLNPVTIYAAYPNPDEWEPYIASEDYVPPSYFIYPDVVGFFELFSGRIAEISEISEWLTIRCERNQTTRYPRIKLRAPAMNHLPAAGSLIQWQGETYRIGA